MIHLARIYDDQMPSGTRVLVDRLWPRGVAKASAPWEVWAKELAPSDALRRRFHAGDLDFAAFSAAYRKELESADPSVLPPGDLVLMTAAKGPANSHAAVLREFLDGQ